jgi:ATP-dependent Lhr-like helicase
MNRSQALRRLEDWFAAGWRSLPFQRAMWRHYLAGESGLLHAHRQRQDAGDVRRPAAAGDDRSTAGTPPRQCGAAAAGAVGDALRALASDTARALQAVIDGLGLGWRVGLRSGDASNRERRQAREGRIDVLVTTPESLALLLSYPDTLPRMRQLRCVVVDEWHELLGNKRGVLLQLNLAVLRDAASCSCGGCRPRWATWPQARDVLLPDHRTHRSCRAFAARDHRAQPAAGTRRTFPWAGHLGLAQLPRVLDALMAARSSLLFTNTRAQAELWHQALARYGRKTDTLALHHGSLDPALRQQVEDGLRAGALRCVVATSSLDLGVDFPRLNRYCSWAARRAWRACASAPGVHAIVPVPAAPSCAPSHALELAEYAAVRRALAEGVVEARRPPTLSLDVLAQHAVSRALAGGFDGDALLAQVAHPCLRVAGR